MTKSKRILAIVILSVVLLLVGYSCYTGSRLTKYPDKIDAYKNQTYIHDGEIMLAFTDDYAWYSISEQEIILLTITDYSEGVITMKKNDTIYRFVAIDENTIYDENTKHLLTRRGADG